jgi:hypothetical protein
MQDIIYFDSTLQCFFSFHGKVDWCSTIQFCLLNIAAVFLVHLNLLTGQSNKFSILFGLLWNYTDSHWSGRKGCKLKSIQRCSLSLWRVVRGSKLMHLDSLIHGLFITETQFRLLSTSDNSIIYTYTGSIYMAQSPCFFTPLADSLSSSFFVPFTYLEPSLL